MAAKRPSLMLDLSPEVYDKYMELSYPVKRALRAKARESLARVIEESYEERFGAAIRRYRAKSPKDGEIQQVEPVAATASGDSTGEPGTQNRGEVVQPESSPSEQQFVRLAAVETTTPPSVAPEYHANQDPGPTLESIGIDMSSWG